MESDCYYCGAAPARVYRPTRYTTSYITNGVDRVENGLGYLPENCSFITRSLNSKKRHQSSPLNHKDEMNPNAKLTIELVKQLRNDLTNKVKIKDLLAIYNISQTQLYRIKNGVRWNSSPLV